MLRFRNHLYRAAVEVSRDALDPQSEFLVAMWLKTSGKEPGTPEYAELEKKFIARALEMTKSQAGDQRINLAEAESLGYSRR